MILAKGRLWDSGRQDEILSGLEAYINRIRSTKRLPRETVIRAVDALGKRLEAGEFDAQLVDLLGAADARRIKTEAATAMRREALEYRCGLELGDTEEAALPVFGEGGIRVRARLEPLGTILHIAAGNADGMAAFSAFEGLLTGNFNIVKLPSADNGLTLTILEKLIEEEPELADFLAVFDTPSSDTAAIGKMAAMADGIAVWGGDEAIRAVRAAASPGVKLIEWGHRLGFAYLSGYRDREEEYAALARHIIETKQLLCSSCQVIYLDTARMEDCEAFTAEFLPVLEKAAREHPAADIGQQAQLSVRTWCRRLERAAARAGGNDADRDDRGARVYEGENCSLTVCRDSALELSPLYGDVLVKRLPEKNLLPVLRQAKGRLQTAGLIASDEKRERLTELLIRAGVCRVMTAGHMSAEFIGGSHDGEYPLRRYVRAVNIETE